LSGTSLLTASLLTRFGIFEGGVASRRTQVHRRSAAAPARGRAPSAQRPLSAAARRGGHTPRRSRTEWQRSAVHAGSRTTRPGRA
jgi:hypothetical protein